jgi:hypothetical protein
MRNITHARNPESNGLRACLACKSCFASQCIRCGHMQCLDCGAGGEQCYCTIINQCGQCGHEHRCM